MAKVIRAFRERYQGMKLYNIDDEYQADDEKRVQYLISQGFLEEVEREDDLPPTIEQFADMSAPEQKGVLFRFNIDGDDSNVEKREALFRQFLGISDNNPPEDPAAPAAPAAEDVTANDPGA